METARKVEISSGYLGFSRRKEGHRRKSFYNETTITENLYRNVRKLDYATR